MPDAVNYHRWIIDLIEPHVRGPLLEIGFGFAQYTRALAGHVDRLLAVDIEPAFFEVAGSLPDHVELMQADITDRGFADTVGRETFNSIICLNVLEHVEHDVATLRSFHDAMRPGGALMLLVPAHQHLYGPMDELAGHYRRYGRKQLAGRLREAGFEIHRLACFNPLGGLGWWVNSRLMRPKTLSDPAINRQILFFDRFVQPLSRLLNPLTSSLFGQSLWALALRPGDRDAV